MMPAEPNDPLYIARLVSMWEDAIGDKYFHASWFNRGGETVLGETSDPCELFLVDLCDDTLLSAVMGKVCVERKTHPSDWRMLGGHEELENESGEQEDENKFFFQKWYEQDTARFEDPPLEYLEVSDHGVCQCCVRNMRKVRGNMTTCMVLSKLLCLQSKGPSGVGMPLGVSNKVTEYDGFEFAGKKYSVGDSVYLPPDTHKFSVKSSKNSLPKCPQRDRSDEATYPELYRKSEYIKGSNSDVPKAFQIGNTCHFTWNNRVRVPMYAQVK